MKRLASWLAVLTVVVAGVASAAPPKRALALFTATSTLEGNTFTTATCFAQWWWDTAYRYRAPVTVTAGSPTTAGHSVRVVLDHRALVAGARSLASGDDVRIVRWDGTACGWVELDRVLETGSAWDGNDTQLWFAAPSAMGAGAVDASYYLYYGHPGADAPPVDGRRVFRAFDPFDGPGLAPAWSVLRPPTAGWSVAAGRLELGIDRNKTFRGTTNTAPLFAVAATSGDFEVQVTQSGVPNANGVTAGVLVYDDDDNYVAAYHGRTTSERVEFVREVNRSAASQVTPVASGSVILRLRKDANRYTASYSTDGGASFVQVGAPRNANIAPVAVGVTAFSSTSNVGPAHGFDDFRVRSVAGVEPSVAVGGEVALP